MHWNNSGTTVLGLNNHYRIGFKVYALRWNSCITLLEQPRNKPRGKQNTIVQLNKCDNIMTRDEISLISMDQCLVRPSLEKPPAVVSGNKYRHTTGQYTANEKP